MSKSVTIAQAMADRLNALATLPDVEALVWRQKELASELAAKLGKATGAVVVILYEGFANPNANASGQLSVARRYTVTIFAKPVLRGSSSISGDDIAEITARSLHDWEPDETTSGFAQIHVRACDLRPDDKFLIYDLDIEALGKL